MTGGIATVAITEVSVHGRQLRTRASTTNATVISGIPPNGRVEDVFIRLNDGGIEDSLSIGFHADGRLLITYNEQTFVVQGGELLKE